MLGTKHVEAVIVSSTWLVVGSGPAVMPVVSSTRLGSGLAQGR